MHQLELIKGGRQCGPKLLIILGILCVCVVPYAYAGKRLKPDNDPKRMQQLLGGPCINPQADARRGTITQKDIDAVKQAMQANDLQRLQQLRKQMLQQGGMWHIAETQRRIREAERQADYRKAYALQKGLVRHRCDSEYDWFYLGRLAMQAAKPGDAVQVLEVLYDRGSNDVEKRLAQPYWQFVALKDQDSFLHSSLHQKMQGRKKAYETRQKKFKNLLGKLTLAQRPPSDYVSKDVCPFECCRYGKWSVVKDTALVDKAMGTKQVGQAKKDSQLHALTGDVYLEPMPIGVNVPLKLGGRIAIKQGEIMFLLDYMGEGYAHVWRDGKVLEIEVIEKVKDYCPHPSEQCWGEFLVPSSDRKKSQWWVKFKLADGSIGWARADGNFGDMGGCG